MNWKRIVAGGLAAGVVIDLFEGGLSGVLVGKQFGEELSRLGVSVRLGAASGIFFVLWGFVVGIVNVFLYAAVRPRLGPGPKTALAVAVAIWVVHGVLPHLRDAALGLFSLELCLEFIAMQLVWQILATLLGAFLYREEDPVR